MTIRGMVLFVGFMGVAAIGGWLISTLLGRRDAEAHQRNLAALHANAAFEAAAHEFVLVVLESHPELIEYDQELRSLAERVARERERAHRAALHAIFEDTNDGYQSPVRKFLQ